MELWRRRNKLLWQKMEEKTVIKVIQGEVETKKEFHKVITKIRGLTIRDETGPSTRLTPPETIQGEPETPEIEEADVLASVLENTIAVKANNSNHYLGLISGRYISIGKRAESNTMQNGTLVTLFLKSKKKFAIDLRKILGKKNKRRETNKHFGLPTKTNIRSNPAKKEHEQHLSTRSNAVFYDDKIIIPQASTGMVMTLSYKGHPAINKMSAVAKLFRWPKLTKEIQTKCKECISCKMAGKSMKPQITMTEINYMHRQRNRIRNFQLDFIGPIRYKQGVFTITSFERCS